MKQFEREFDLYQLFNHCTRLERDYDYLGIVTGQGKDKTIYIDRGSNILAIAHLDTVLPFQSFLTSGSKVYCQTLDDRLGAYIICDLLPNIGVITDVLLTTNEEHGLSSAKYFKPSKDYNWIFQFDRGGLSTVLYQYDDDNLYKLLSSYNIDVSYGSYSDICELDFLGCKGINFASAYYQNHFPNCYFDTSELSSMLRKFKRFYNDYKDISLPHSDNDINRLYDYDWCELCGKKSSELTYDSELELYLCDDCIEYAINGESINKDWYDWDYVNENPKLPELNQFYDS